MEYIRRFGGILHPLEVELASLVKVFQLLIELLANGEIHQERIGLSVRLEQKDAGSLEKGGFYVHLFCYTVQNGSKDMSALFSMFPHIGHIWASCPVASSYSHLYIACIGWCMPL